MSDHDDKATGMTGSPPISNRGMLAGVTIIAALGALIRCLYMWQGSSSPLFGELVLDAQNYHDWGLRIAAGDLLGEGAFSSNPLYPYLLGLFYRLVGEELGLLRWIQQGAGLATALMVMRVTWLQFGRVAALVALALGALYGPVVFLAAELLAETWVIFLLAGSLWLAFESHHAGPAAAASRWDRPVLAVGAPALQARFGAGLLLGLACLGRPNLLPFAAFLLLYTLLPRERVARRGGSKETGLRLLASALPTGVRWRHGAAVALGLMVAIGPVTTRNILVSGEPVLITAHGGFNLWIGNNEDASGWFRTPRGSGLAGDQLGLIRSAHRIAERATGEDLTARAASSWWSRRAVTFAAEQPHRWLALTAKKTFYFLNTYEKPLVAWYSVGKEHSPALRWGTVGFGLLLPLAVMGAVATRRHLRARWLLLSLVAISSVTVILFFVSMRYRLPVVVGLLPLAGAGVAALPGLARAGRGALMPALVAFALAVAVSNVPLAAEARKDHAHALYLVGRSATEEGSWDVALDALERAVSLDPDNPFFVNSLGIAYTRSDRLDKAVATHRRSVELRPESAMAWLNLGVALRSAGELDEAAEVYRKALELSPRYVKAWHNLGNVEAGRGDLEAARRHWEKALSINPAFEPSQRRLAALPPPEEEE